MHRSFQHVDCTRGQAYVGAHRPGLQKSEGPRLMPDPEYRVERGIVVFDHFTFQKCRSRWLSISASSITDMRRINVRVLRVLCLRGAVVSYSSSSVKKRSLQAAAEAIIYSEIKCKTKQQVARRPVHSFHFISHPPPPIPKPNGIKKQKYPKIRQAAYIKRTIFEKKKPQRKMKRYK